MTYKNIKDNLHMDFTPGMESDTVPKGKTSAR